MELQDHQWEIIGKLFPKPKSGPGKSGRPSVSTRDVFEAVLWILRTGAPWHDLPDRYPPYQTCHRHFQSWVGSGTLRRVLKALWDDLRDRGGVKNIEGYIDGTYVPAKKGGPTLASPVPARRQRSWRLQTALVFQSEFALQMVQGTTSPSLTEHLILPSSKPFRRN